MYHQPKTLSEALTLKSEYRANAHFIAGGTDLVVGIRKGKPKPNNLIDLSRIESLKDIGESDGKLVIGAGVNHARLERTPLRALRQAAETVGGPQIRNLGTIGGQLGTASPAGDVSVALMALGATLELASEKNGERIIPIRDFFLSYATTALAEDEMIKNVIIPLEQKSGFYKIGKRSAVAISVVVVAAASRADGSFGLGLGCVAPMPIPCQAAETYLEQYGLNESSIKEAGNIVRQHVKPIDDHRGGAEYRKAMAERLSCRLLSDIADMNAMDKERA